MSTPNDNLNNFLYTDDVLTRDDFKYVYSWLDDACTEWFNIGLTLSVKLEKLRSIQEMCHANHSVCLREMLDYRIKSGPLTIREVCGSLRNKLVRRNTLAQKLENGMDMHA